MGQEVHASIGLPARPRSGGTKSALRHADVTSARATRSTRPLKS